METYANPQEFEAMLKANGMYLLSAEDGHTPSYGYTVCIAGEAVAVRVACLPPDQVERTCPRCQATHNQTLLAQPHRKRTELCAECAVGC